MMSAAASIAETSITKNSTPAVATGGAQNVGDEHQLRLQGDGRDSR
jgi:hypothetical protein